MPFYFYYKKDFFIYRNSIRTDVETTKNVATKSKAGTKGKRRVKKTTISPFESEDVLPSILDSEIAYDEYEEDKSFIEWLLKPKVPSRFSLLVYIFLLSVIY